MADRLNNRKSEAAQRSLMRKIDLVKQMQQFDPEELAQKFLELRKKRREYESRLGVTSGDSASDEF
jgi:hypothetical protein